MGMQEMLEGRKPFFLQGDSEEGVLCLHGFTGSPGNYRKLAKTLQSKGFTVSVPLLPGHGTVPEDMADCTEGDWLKAAEAALEQLQSKCARVHVVGLSLGGALTACLAAKHPELGSAVLLSPAFAINPFIIRYLGIDLASAARAPKDRLVPLPARQPDGGEMDECIFGYNGFPVPSISALHGASEWASESYPRIRVPVCLVYSMADKIVDPHACVRLARQCPSLVREISLENFEHNLLLDTRHQEMEEKVLEFLVSRAKP